MTTKNTDLKSEAYIEEHDLTSKVTIDEKGKITTTNDLHESLVLLDSGVTLDQFKKIEKKGDQLFSAVTLVGGRLSESAFKANPELTETTLSYQIGAHSQATVIYSRDSSNHVVAAIETRVKSAEHKRVVAHINSLFDDINN